MCGANRFILNILVVGPSLTVVAAGPISGAGGAVQRASGTAGVMTLLPCLTYAPDLGTYSKWWMEEMAGTHADDLENECELYLDAFKRTTIDFPGIVSPPLPATGGLLFLKVLLGNQVCTVHFVGRFSFVLGRSTASHNRIFGILGEKVVGSLPPIAMVLAVGLVPWIYLEMQVNLM